MLVKPPELSPYATVSTASRAEIPVPYHDVPVPRVAEVSSQLDRLQALHHSRGRVDVTALLDLCLRFACLAYRRNAPTTSSALALSAAPDFAPSVCELQFRTSSGAHAVCYLYHEHERLYAVLSFKGSTLASPGAPVLSDWVANLQPVGQQISSYSSPSYDLPRSTELPKVHAGWAAYLESLMVEFQGCILPDVLPEDVRTAWQWPSTHRMDLWQLLGSRKCTHVLLVGHSLGGSLATLAAAKLGLIAERVTGYAASTEQADAAQRGVPPVHPPPDAALDAALDAGSAPRSAPTSGGPPSLVTFGCPVVGDHSFVEMQHRLVRPRGGLRVYNEHDGIVSMGFGLLSLSTATGSAEDHAGLPVPLVNDPFTRANPYTNHLRYVIDSEIVSDRPCVARYKLPGFLYAPEENSSHLPPTPGLRHPSSPPPTQAHGHQHEDWAAMVGSAANTAWDHMRKWVQAEARVHGWVAAVQASATARSSAAVAEAVEAMRTRHAGPSTSVPEPQAAPSSLVARSLPRLKEMYGDQIHGGHLGARAAAHRTFDL